MKAILTPRWSSVAAVKGFFFVIGTLCWASAVAQTDSLRAQLEALAKEGHFVVDGLERIGAEPANIAPGIPAERLKRLLEAYNHIVIEKGPGSIERVVIIGAKRPATKLKASPYIKTTRWGAHHLVEVTITGMLNNARTVSVIVDTGASTIVLPESMIAPLGFQPEDLQNGITRTASGTVAMKVGTVKSVQVGNAFAADVKVTFIADRRLGGMALLGMSFLERFRMTIDDAHDELVLLAR